MIKLAVALCAAVPFGASISAGDVSPLKPNAAVCPTNCVKPDNTYSETNLVSFSPLVPLVDVRRMLATNGLKSFLNVSHEPFEYTGNVRKVLAPPICFVSLFNYSTNDMGCLNMGGPFLCRIALLDRLGQQVERTEVGKTYGSPLTQNQIDEWRRQNHGHGFNIFIRFLPNGILKYADMPCPICSFSIADVFHITKPGQYELHVQTRLIQVGKDSSGTVHYPVTFLPEAVTKVQIGPGEVSK